MSFYELESHRPHPFHLHLHMKTPVTQIQRPGGNKQQQTGPALKTLRFLCLLADCHNHL